MDEKSDTKMGETGVHKSKLIGGSMLMLSVLLTAAVATLIYLAVANGHESCVEKKPLEEVDVQANVQVKTDKNEVNTKIEYSKTGHVAYYYADDGSFNMDDFRKGIHVSRAEEDEVCLVTAIGTNTTNEGGISRFLKDWDGKETSAKVSYVDFEILDGKIKDSSFLTQKVHDECSNGFQWMTVVPAKDNKQVDASDGDSVIAKRSVELSRNKRGYYFICHYHCYYWYVCSGRICYYCPYRCHYHYY